MGSTRPMWVGLDLCDGFGWVEFFFDSPWWVRSKTPLNPTQPDPCREINK